MAYNSDNNAFDGDFDPLTDERLPSRSTGESVLRTVGFLLGGLFCLGMAAFCALLAIGGFMGQDGEAGHKIMAVIFTAAALMFLVGVKLLYDEWRRPKMHR